MPTALERRVDEQVLERRIDVQVTPRRIRRSRGATMTVDSGQACGGFDTRPQGHVAGYVILVCAKAVSRLVKITSQNGMRNLPS
eukprot:1724285-Prymnesium_polylepis.1